ncbi:MAG: class II aldolase/adducin family protein [bacterium]
MLTASPFVIKKALVQVGQKLYARGLVAGTDGNLSVRLDDDRILITPSGTAKGCLEAEDLIIVDINGKRLQGSRQASSEIGMHLAAYHERPEVRACIHSHAPYATAFAVAGIALAQDILPEVVLMVGSIPLTDYAPPGTDEVAKVIRPHLPTCNALLLRNHGLLTLGRSLDEAYYRHETVEHYAKIVHLARQLGNVDAIPSDDYRRLEQMRQKLDQAWDQQK